MKQYIITLEEKQDGTGFSVSRENNGFNFYELLGILEHTQQDLIYRMKNSIAPDEVKTRVILEEK